MFFIANCSVTKRGIERFSPEMIAAMRAVVRGGATESQIVFLAKRRIDTHLAHKLLTDYERRAKFDSDKSK